MEEREGARKGREEREGPVGEWVSRNRTVSQ